jgi:hypothetical protein
MHITAAEEIGADAMSNDVAQLLKYSGSSLRCEEPMPDGVALLDYCGTELLPRR